MTTIEPLSRTVFGRRQRSAEPRSSSLEIRNLTFTDDDGLRLLEGANLAIGRGAKICIVGSTGKEQAALLALILGLYRPDRGSVIVDGRDVASLPMRAARESVALVLQDPWLPHGSVAENIAFGHPGVERADIEAIAEQLGIDDFIEELPAGYDTMVGRGGGGPVAAELTAGQRRRIALARALIRNPGVLVFEEPTTGLDVDEERLMIRAIDAASHGRTAVLATHRLSLARRSDAVHVIEAGAIVPYHGAGRGQDHSKLWDLQVPPVLTPSTRAGAHLRLVRRGDRAAPSPTSTPWGITIGAEIAPGHLASGLLGRTADTETWVAWSIEREEPVRIKIPRADPVSYTAFELLFREYRTIRACNHPSLAATYGADLDAEIPYVVFEYLDSTSLSRVAKRRGAGMDPLDILYTGFELAAAINYLHQRGFVHLDLRAGNVRTRQDTIVITDFAHCLPVGAELRAAASTTGSSDGGRPASRRHLAPEVLPGRAADPKMDVFALGALMHRATAGSVVAKVTGNRTALVPYGSLARTAPAPMADMVDAMLVSDPADRPGADEVLSEFRRILPSSLVRPRVSAAAARSPRLRLVGNHN